MQINCTKSQLRKIGKKIRNGEKLSVEDEVNFTDFRKGHDKILSCFRSRINYYLSDPENKNVIFAQRLKKRETIINKLQNRHTEMDLLRMHDIAGMRLIFSNMKLLEKFRSRFVNIKSKKYVRTNDLDKYNYIKTPREKTGYRGIHDVYEENTKDPIKMHMELQYRTKVQHAWSTTLEIWDSSFNRKAKFELENDDIASFFRYISELFARKLEKSSFMKDLTDYELFKKIVFLDGKLGIISKLKKIKRADYKISHYNLENEYILLQKIIESRKQIILNIKVANSDDININFDLYKNLEKLYNDVVMVRVRQPQRFLDKAYNNYYNDLSDFFKYYDSAMKLLRISNKLNCNKYAFLHNWKYFEIRDLFLLLREKVSD